MTLLNSRTTLKPFKYQWAFDYYLKQNQMHWLPEEVTFHEDVRDWNQNVTEEEKNLLTHIFRFFTQGDTDVANAYMHRYSNMFGYHPEVNMMLAAIANMEGVHQHAYSLLLDTVGMPETEYEAFMDYRAMADKHTYVSSFMKGEQQEDDREDIPELLKEIAVYSAFTEGMQLFSSFAILMNFPRFNKMKGMGQIVTWSIRDETLHVEAMMKVFHTLKDEFIGEFDPSALDTEIYKVAVEMVQLEDKFIDLAFELGGIEGLEPKETKAYIRYICDHRLEQLGMQPLYGVEEHPLPWLVEVLNGTEHANFFESRSTEYSKSATQGEWGDVF